MTTEKKADGRRAEASESTLLRREAQKKNHFVFTESVFLLSFLSFH